MRIYVINDTSGDWNVWLTWGGGWSNEWPDARQWRTRKEAQLYLDQAREHNPDRYAGASVYEDETEDA